MRRMIPSKLIDWIKNLKDKFIHNSETNTTEFGGNVEVDGNIQVNGRLVIESEPIDLFSALSISVDENNIWSSPYTAEYINEFILKNRFNYFSFPLLSINRLPLTYITFVKDSNYFEAVFSYTYRGRGDKNEYLSIILQQKDNGERVLYEFST